jgi:cell division protein FtsQ
MTRSLPHTIRLLITARQPLAVLPDGAAFDVIDSDGVRFDRVQAPGQHPLIAETDADRQQVARGVLASLPEALRKRVARITAPSPDNVSMALRDGAQVTWGSNEDVALKATVLAALLESKAAHYDLSAPMMPTTSGTVS